MIADKTYTVTQIKGFQSLQSFAVLHRKLELECDSQILTLEEEEEDNDDGRLYNY